MRNSLWTVMALAGAFLGFAMGYATPPMVETGMLAGTGAPPKAEPSKDLEQYYKDLYKQ